METKLKLFNEKNVRAVWDEDEEEWYFSVVDVVAVLTDSENPRTYWKVLKHRLSEEGSEVVTNCNQLKMQAADGKSYKTDALTTEGVLRLIQSIPSPKAEPFKVWLAQVGSERLDEIADPEKAILRAQSYYRRKGYSEEWIKERMLSIEARKKLTDEWKAHGIEDDLEFAILTNEMTKAWSGKSVKEYKQYKGLKKENLRDNMTDLELALNALAEVTTRALTARRNPQGLEENKQVARSGGNVSRTARLEIEEKLGETVISPANAKDKARLDTKKELPTTEDE